MPPASSIDTLRGLACVLLVGFHVIGYNQSTGLQLPPEHVASRLNDWLSLVRMPLFSLLSGFVYACRPSRQGTLAFAGKKARRLLLPMLLVGTGFALLQAFGPGSQRVAYDWTMLHVVPVAHYWFLEALFILCLAAALLDRVGGMDTPVRFALVWAVATALKLSGVLPTLFAIQGASYLAPFFLLGIGLRRFPGWAAHAWTPLVPALLLLAVVVAWTVQGTVPLTGPTTALELAAACGTCLLLFTLRPDFAWLRWIGPWSFGIYLFHPVFTAAARMGLQRLGVQDLAVLLAGGLAAGLLGPIAVTAVLRRLPLGHWALGERPRQPRPVPVFHPSTL